MKGKFCRRNFLQTVAISASGVALPAYVNASGSHTEISKDELAGELPKRRLGRTNLMVSCIGFGTGSRYCNWIAKDAILQKHIDYAINLGINYFDAARSYGNGLAEERYGKFLTPKYRSLIILTSKSQKRTYDGVMRDIETSLTTMKTDHLDLYFMHGIDHVEQADALLEPDGGYKAFLKLRDEGTVKNIAFSFHKWNEASQKCLKEFDVDAVMCPINASLNSGCEEHLIPLALKRDIGIIAMKVLGQNALIGNVSGDDLVRFSLSLPIALANIGMDGFSPLQACVKIGREPVLTDEEARKIHIKLDFDPKITRLPYFS
ncbi:MAG: aldo/keto reductase [Mariniphaga sp.]|nr:aldo/keto reductase [Mariniphaga sp.]